MDVKKSSGNVSSNNNTFINSASLKEIVITYGKAKGINAISAFDRALWNAGIANYNLIKLTSIIPKGSNTIVRKFNKNKHEIGNKLYVVLSECRESICGNEAWAGLGWTQAGDKSGFFVEQSGNNEKAVIESIRESISYMKKYRDLKWGDIKYKVEGIKCEEKPVCALVCAIFKSVGW